MQTQFSTDCTEDVIEEDIQHCGRFLGFFFSFAEQMTSDDFRNLVIRVLVDNSRVKGMQKRIHQPFAFPQPLPGLCSIRADVPGGNRHGEKTPGHLHVRRCPFAPRRQPRSPQTPGGVLEDRGPLGAQQLGGFPRVFPPA